MGQQRCVLLLGGERRDAPQARFKSREKRKRSARCGERVANARPISKSKQINYASNALAAFCSSAGYAIAAASQKRSADSQAATNVR